LAHSADSLQAFPVGGRLSQNFASSVPALAMDSAALKANSEQQHIAEHCTRAQKGELPGIAGTIDLQT
jgi:hypothetical protein